MNGYKTIVGALIVIAVEIARLVFGVDLGDPAELGAGIAAIGGAAFAIYGRIVATRSLLGKGDLQ